MKLVDARIFDTLVDRLKDALKDNSAFNEVNIPVLLDTFLSSVKSLRYNIFFHLPEANSHIKWPAHQI